MADQHNREGSEEMEVTASSTVWARYVVCIPFAGVALWLVGQMAFRLGAFAIVGLPASWPGWSYFVAPSVICCTLVVGCWHILRQKLVTVKGQTVLIRGVFYTQHIPLVDVVDAYWIQKDYLEYAPIAAIAYRADEGQIKVAKFAPRSEEVVAQLSALLESSRQSSRRSRVAASL